MNLKTYLLNHPLFVSLRKLRGNRRACVFTEPLWGIPNSLFTPFASLYMYALGVSYTQIGMIASLFLFLQILTALLGGVLTDKLGRRRTTLWFDLLSWTIPCLLWIFAHNFYWFLLAAAINSMWQITQNSWTCLLVEDAENDTLIHTYNWIYIAGQLAVFFAPVSAFFVKRLSVVPAMRILYGFAAVSMTAKFVLLYHYSRETSYGQERMREMRGVSFFTVLQGYIHKLPLVVGRKAPEMLRILFMMIVFQITGTITTTFFGLYATQALRIHESFLAYFPILRSLIMLCFMFVIQSRLDGFSLRVPILTGIVLYIAGHCSLLAAPTGRAAYAVPYVVMEACAYAMVMPRKDTIIAMFVVPGERAVILSLLTLLTLLVSAPFGYIGGALFQWNTRLPFCLNIVLFLLAAVVVSGFQKLKEE